MIAYISLSLVEMNAAVSVFTVKAPPVALLLSRSANETAVAHFVCFNIIKHRTGFCYAYLLVSCYRLLQASFIAMVSRTLKMAFSALKSNQQVNGAEGPMLSFKPFQIIIYTQ